MPLQKYPFRTRKGLIFTNLLSGDVLVKKSIAVCNVKPKFLEQLGSPEQIFHRRLSLGAPECCGNIVAEGKRFFSVCGPRKHFRLKQKCQKHFASSANVSSFARRGNISGNNVSATIFPRLRPPLKRWRNTSNHFYRLWVMFRPKFSSGFKVHTKNVDYCSSGHDNVNRIFKKLQFAQRNVIWDTRIFGLWPLVRAH